MDNSTPLTQHDDVDVYGGQEGVDRFLPPEQLLDHEDPTNDRYFRHLASIRIRIEAQCRKCRPRQVQAARMHHRGKTNKEIAAKLNYNQSTVSGLLKRPNVVELLGLLRRAAQFIEGPNVALRKNMLWRIAATNELQDPATAITAVKELNKLDGAYPQASYNPNPQVTIVINQDQMPKTALDAPLILEHDPNG